MATTVFGGDNGDLSQHSSLISEGSAIAEIERELQDVVSRGSHGDRERTKKEQLRSLNNFTTPTLNFDPSDASTCTESDELSDVAAPQSSTGYIPTALEQQRSECNYMYTVHVYISVLKSVSIELLDYTSR